MGSLSPLDGRYKKAVEGLLPYFSEEALNRTRAEVEVRYFIFLSKESAIKELSPVNAKQENLLKRIYEQFSDRDHEEIKKHESVTKHDVKAVEYFLKSRVARISKLKRSVEFIHFALTSEDVNNLAYGLLITRALKSVTIPALKSAISEIRKMASQSKKVNMLSLTHGQPATPTTLGKELLVFADRLDRQLKQLSAFQMQGKFGGAVGTYSAHRAAYPQVQWEKLGAKFIRSLGLDPLANTTQINPHDDLAELSHICFRINTIGIDLCRDVWSYISRGIFRQQVAKGEVGSSTMPHKVNPIDFENAEGNFGLANALFSHFAEKLPISRMQRDLSDSTVQRSIGSAFGYQLLAFVSLTKGLGKLTVDRKVLKAELDAHPEVHAEAIQTVLRKNGIHGGYEMMKEFTRGEKVTLDDLRTFIKKLRLPDAEKKRLMELL